MEMNFELMEKKLYHGIMWPSMLLTLCNGTGLIAINGMSWLSQSPWLQIKILIVIALCVYQLYLGQLRKAFPQPLVQGVDRAHIVPRCGHASAWPWNPSRGRQESSQAPSAPCSRATPCAPRGPCGARSPRRGPRSSRSARGRRPWCAGASTTIARPPL